MIRVNLIRDRVARPPTVTDRIVQALPFVLLLLYALCAAAASTLGIRATAAAYGLESRLLAERDILVDIGRRRGGYSPSDEEDITSLGNIVRLYGRKQHWGVKLAALQQSVPDGVTVTSFAGQVMQAVRVRAVADDADGAGLKRIQAFAQSLEANDLFTEGVTEVNLARITNRENEDEAGALEFVIDCPILGDGQGGPRERSAARADDRGVRVPGVSAKSK